MKFFPAALSAICLVVATPQEASAGSPPAKKYAAFPNGISRVMTALESELQSKSDSDSDSKSNRQLEDLITDDYFYLSLLADDDLAQCVLDSANLRFANPDLEQADFDFESSLEITSTVDDDLTVTMTGEYPQEARDLYQQACSDARGYYTETNGQIVCHHEFMGSKVVTTFSGLAICQADTVECRSTDFVELATDISQAIGFEGECTDGTLGSSSGVALGVGTSLMATTAGLLVRQLL